MKNLREVKDDLLKEWIEFREETAFCEMTPKDKKYCIDFDEISEKILKNVKKILSRFLNKVSKTTGTIRQELYGLLILLE